MIKDWLKYASDRDGGRKKRKNAEGNQQEPNVPRHYTLTILVLSSGFAETYHNRFRLDNFNFRFPVGIFWKKE